LSLHLFGEIAGELVKALREGIPDASNDMVVAGSPPQPIGALPRLFIYSPKFTFDDGGLGGGGGEATAQVSDSLDGDGKATAFTLSERPYRPLIRVESPRGQPKVENVDFTVNYNKSSIAFKSPPTKGKGNVVVRYNSSARSGKTRQVRLNIAYNIDVCAADEKQRDDLAIDAIKAVALAQEDLSTKGFQVKPVDGMDVPSDPEAPNGAFVKRLGYSVEASLQVVIPVPPIESVEVKQLPSEK
jgi:hypothetical protein